MQTHYAKKAALGAIVAVAAAAGLGAGSAASHTFRIPEEPDVTIGQRAPEESQARVARVVASLGFDRRCGREAFAFRVGKKQGTPAC